MRIILEGPDNAGKTSLAKSIMGLARPGVEYFHPGGPPKTFEDEVMSIERQLEVLALNDRIVMDRVTPISQRVYNQNKVFDHFRSSVFEKYESLNPIVVYCRPSTDKLLRQQDLTWRDDETEDHKQKIINGLHLFVERYDRVMQDVFCVHYDYESDLAPDLVQQLASHLNGNVHAKDRLQFIMARGGSQWK